MIGQPFTNPQAGIPPVGTIIQQIMTAAIHKDNATLALFKSKGISLDIKNPIGLSAAMILGNQLHLPAVNFLWDKIGNQIDIAIGMAYCGSDLAEEYINKLPEDKRDYLSLACWAAKGGHQAVTERFLKKLPKDKRNYLSIAHWAIAGGHQALAEHYLNKLPEDKRNYQMTAVWAAKMARQAIAETFLNKLPLDKRDYHKVAYAAAIAGHQSIAEYFSNKQPQNRGNTFSLACAAANGGHLPVAQHFLNKLPQDRHSYLGVADWATRGGHHAIAAYFMTHPAVTFMAASTLAPKTTPQKRQLQETPPTFITPAFSAQLQSGIKRRAIGPDTVRTSIAGEQNQSPNNCTSTTSTSLPRTDNNFSTHPLMEEKLAQLESRIKTLEAANAQAEDELKKVVAANTLCRM